MSRSIDFFGVLFMELIRGDSAIVESMTSGISHLSPGINPSLGVMRQAGFLIDCIIIDWQQKAHTRSSLRVCVSPPTPHIHTHNSPQNVASILDVPNCVAK